MTAPLVDLKNIYFTYQNNTVLDDVNVSIPPNSIVTLIGPNGSGKTTLVKILLGLLKASSGQMIRSRELIIGYVPQKFHIDPSIPLTVRKFIRLGFSGAEHDIDDALDKTGASYVNNQSIHNLSGGELQRVLLSKAILKKPDLLILDEPVQGVDLMGQNLLYALISSIQKSIGCSVLVVSHDLNFVMAQSDKVICLNQHICCSGSPDSVSSDPSYLEIFGQFSHNEGAPRHVTTYTHHHDHEHNVGGTISHSNDENHTHG